MPTQPKKSQGKKSPVKKAKRKQSPAKPKASGKAADRIDKLVEAQKTTIGHVSDFVADVATLTAKGNFSPEAWMKHYSTLLKGLSDDLAAAAKALLKD